MKRNKLRKAVIGLLDVTLAEGTPRNKPAPFGKLVETIELKQSLSDLQRDRYWKEGLKKKVMEKGYDVLSVSILHQDHPQGFSIAISVVRSKQGLQRNRPVSRGGKEIGPPTQHKTMAARRRGQRGVIGGAKG